MNKPVFAVGTQGSKFVKVRNGEFLPCVHQEFHLAGTSYHQVARYDQTNPGQKAYIDAIKAGRVVKTLSKDIRKGDFKRSKYVEGFVFLVKDVTYDDVNGLKFTFCGSEAA